MQAPVEVRYAGIVVGRAQEVRSDDDPSTFFLPGKDPMPVGTVVQLRSGDTETPARVLHAIESSDPTVAGMKVRLIGEAEAVAPDWIPAPALAPNKTTPKASTPTPTVEVDLGLMQTEMPEAPAVLDAATLVAPREAVPEPIPEAVPVAVASSLTGALEQATESAAPPKAAAEPTPVSATEAKAGDKDSKDDKDTQETATIPSETAPAEAAAPVATATTASGERSAASGEENAAAPTTEEMPVARPISGPSGRRKTKRRR